MIFESKFRSQELTSGGQEQGYEDIAETRDRRAQRLAGENSTCKLDNKTYTNRRFDRDGSGGSGGFGSGAGMGGWRAGKISYTAPGRT